MRQSIRRSESPPEALFLPISLRVLLTTLVVLLAASVVLEAL